MKGQGIIEYGIILMLIVCVGVCAYSLFRIQDNMTTMYAQIESNLGSMASNNATYDTGRIFTHNNIDWHQTNLTYSRDEDLFSGGSGGTSTNQKDYTVYWRVDANGNREYRVGMLVYDKNNRTNSLMPKSGDVSYFYTTSGNYYKITTSDSNTSIEQVDKSQVTGSLVKITYVPSTSVSQPHNSFFSYFH
jgi:Flp pilus assembly pilin Flp